MPWNCKNRAARCRQGERRRSPSRATLGLEPLEARVALAVSDLQYVDDGTSGPYSAGYSQSGAWSPRVHEGSFGDSAVSARGTGADTAKWLFTVEPGEYRISTTWFAAGDRATNATYSVWDGLQKVGNAVRNQKLTPASETDLLGVKWSVFGTYTITGKSLGIVLTDQADGSVCADAVRIQRVSAPLRMSIEPMTSGAVVYEPIAPGTAGAKGGGMNALRLELQNFSDAAATIDRVVVTFPLSTVPSKTINGSRGKAADDSDAPFLIPSGRNTFWSFRHNHGAGVDDRIWFEGPAPALIRVEVWVTNYAKPLARVLPLKAHVSPVAGGSYLFPARASDLEPLEFWSAATEHHADGRDASQIFGYDMGVVGYDAAIGRYNHLKPGTDGTLNADHRIFQKPLYAMAAGSVLKFIADVPSNPEPLVWEDDADLQKQMESQRDLYWGSKAEDAADRNAENIFRGSGNCLYIQHGDEVVLYAHLDPNSIPLALQKVGAVVKAGQYVGRVGNTGNSTGPHVHIHVVKGKEPEGAGPLRPFRFVGIQALAESASQLGTPFGPWVPVAGQAIPREKSLVWPAATKPSWYPPGKPRLMKSGIKERDYQTEFDRLVSSGYRLVDVDASNTAGGVLFAVTAVPAAGKTWSARHGMTAAQFAAETSLRAGQGMKLVKSDSYVSGLFTRYVAIYAKP